MKVGICSSVSDIAAVRAAGADFLEENVQRFLKPAAPDAEFELNLAAAAASPVPLIAANNFLPKELVCVGPNVSESGVLAYADVALRRAAACGIEALVFGSGAARRVPDGFDRVRAFAQFVELVGKIAPSAERAGVVVVIEPLNRGETNFINSLADGARLVREVGHPSVRLLADIFHMLRDGEPAGEIVAYGELLRHVHIAERDQRTPPGVRGDDFAPYFAALRDAAYAGPVSIECRWGDFAAEAARAVETVRRCASR